MKKELIRNSGGRGGLNIRGAVALCCIMSSSLESSSVYEIPDACFKLHSRSE